MQLRYNFIAIEGNIGAGKTSLASRMASDFSTRLILEQFEENSFLPKFYTDPDKYAFPLEMSFLAERYQQLKETLAQSDLFHQNTISDYFINKSLIFARKTLKEDEYLLYYKLFYIISNTLPKPDLLVYLYVSIEKLQENIRKRGRDYEQKIPDSYLIKIQESYFEYIRQQKDMKILLLDTNNIDFVNNENDYQRLVNTINTEYSTGIHRIVL